MSDSNDQNQDDQNDKNEHSDDQDDEQSTEGLKNALKAERDARKQLDKDLKTVRRELDSLKNSGKSETDKRQELERERDELRLKIRERDAKDTALDIATKAGADGKNAGVIWRAIKSDVEYDDDGEPENLKTLIDDLKETTPHLFRKASGPADAGKGTNGAAKGNFDMSSLIRQATGRGT